MHVNANLWSHQQQMLDFALTRLEGGVSNPNKWGDDFYGAMWLAGCATGKTLTTLKLIEEVGARKVLVISTKAGVPSAWIREVNKWTTGLDIVAAHDGSVKKKQAMLEDAPLNNVMMYAINYESAWRMADDIRRYGFDLVIADESHKLKSHNSKVSREMAKACKDIPYKLNMTGTAWDDKPTDIYGQARFLAPAKYVSSSVFGSWSRFFANYVITHDLPDGRKIPVGYKNQARLAQMVASFTTIVDSEEVLDLPPFHDITRHVSLSGKMRKAYDSMYQDMIARIDDDILVADNRLVQSLRLQQLARGHYTDGRVETVKKNPVIQETMSVLDEIGGKPTVIFTNFSEDVAMLSEAVSDMGLTPKLLVGGKHEHIEFQDGQGDVLIANISAGAESVDLTRADYGIYYAKPFSRTQYVQSRYRIRRPNSSKTKHFFHVIVEDTIDNDIESALAGKGDISDYLIQNVGNRIT